MGFIDWPRALFEYYTQVDVLIRAFLQELFPTMKMVFKDSIWDIVIYKQSLTVSKDIAHQRNQMPMVYPTNDLYLSTEFSFSFSHYPP